ncbi:IS3 family transposase [Streptomyces sp. NBC_00378]|uniref:IS3 family transposase n=1 Tax=Streptomyces sp. NBC_00378 TaxID=2975732 RepID=UPI00224DEAEF|nr:MULTISPECIES: IS3 family transposase [unclassified Streptomyces]MCX5107094.1 IS3 family transposase [Streptomyces sp. NBC_00378]
MRISGEVRGQLAVMFDVLFPHLDERQCRLLMGAEARILGRGGIRAVAQAAEVSETTVRKGVDELEAGAEPLGRVRRPGGGRKWAVEVDPGLRPALLALVERDVRGDPMSPLRWTTKSTRKLADEIRAIRAIHAEHHGVYGAPRVHAELRARGRRINRKRVAWLMRINHIVGRHLRKKKRTTIADRTAPPAPDLVMRDFTAHAEHQVVRRHHL